MDPTCKPLSILFISHTTLYLEIKLSGSNEIIYIPVKVNSARVMYRNSLGSKIFKSEVDLAEQFKISSLRRIRPRIAQRSTVYLCWASPARAARSAACSAAQLPAGCHCDAADSKSSSKNQDPVQGVQDKNFYIWSYQN